MKVDKQAGRQERARSELAGSDPFHLSNAWFRCWYAAFADGREQVLPVAGGKLRYLTGTRRLGPFKSRVTRGATNLQTPYFDVSGTDSLEAAVGAADELLCLTRADMLEFDYVADDALLFRAAQRWTASRRALIQPLGRTALLDCTGSIEDWLASRSAKHRRNWLRGEKNLQRLGTRYEVVTRPDQIGDLCEEVLALEHAGWKGRAGSSILSDARETAFYRAIIPRSAEDGCLQLALLRHEERVIAFELSIVSGGSCIALKTSYDEAYSGYSTGLALMLMHLRELFQMPSVNWYDQLGNSMSPAEHKLRTSTHLRPYYRIRYFAPTARGLALREYNRAYGAAKRARRRLRRTPPLLQPFLEQFTR